MSTTDNTLHTDGRATPLVSVIVRSVGRPELARALDSVALQTYPNIEVLIVNAKGPGNQHLEKWCGGFPFRVVGTGRPLSRSCAANMGLENAKGKYLIFLDEDDYYYPQHVSTLVTSLEESAYKAAYTGILCLTTKADGSSEEEYIFNESFDHIRLLYENYIPIHAVMFDRDFVDAGFRFDEKLDLCEDWDFWLQLTRDHDFNHVNQISAVYCIQCHSASGLWNNKELAKETSIKIYEKWRSRWTPEQLFKLIEGAKVNNELGARLARKDAELAERSAELAERSAELAERTAEVYRLREGEVTLRAHVYQIEQQLRQIYDSTSWRFSFPIRWIGGGIKKILFIVGGFLKR